MTQPNPIAPYICPYCDTVYSMQHTVKYCQAKERENAVKTRSAERQA